MHRAIPLILLILAVVSTGCQIQAPPTPEPTPTIIGTPRPEGSPTPVRRGSVTLQMAESGGPSRKEYSSPPDRIIDPTATYKAIIGTNLGSMTLELFAQDAPKTVNNFVFLAQEGYYDGIIFHRVIPDFMIQGGDPTGTGTSGPGYKFEDEIVSSLVFDSPGILAMANSGPNTNGSQFFITVEATPWLNGNHTIFGKVTDGYDVVNAISVVATAAGNRPLENVVIEGIEITKLN